MGRGEAVVNQPQRSSGEVRMSTAAVKPTGEGKSEVVMATYMVRMIDGYNDVRVSNRHSSAVVS